MRLLRSALDICTVGILLVLGACGGSGGLGDASGLLHDAGEVGDAGVGEDVGGRGDATLDDVAGVDGGAVIDSAWAGVDGCSSLCNAVTPSYPIVEANGGQGNVTMYATAASSGGACNYGVTSVGYYVAVNVNVVPGDGQGEWQGGRICGQCVEVTAFTSQGPASVVVRIMDKCPDGDCGMDLGGSAPAAIMLDGFGRYNGSWRFVSCTGHPEVSDGAPSLFVSSGSNAWWSRVQVRNPASAVASIAWQDPAGSAQGSFPYATDPENTFEVPTAVLQSSTASIVITVQYTDGTTTTANLSPSQLSAENTAYPLN
jgi:hypothetical protein